MATTTTVSSQFAGALAGEIFVQAFKKADTIGKGMITVLPNVIGTGYLPKLAYSQSLAAYSCGFTPNGTVTYTDKTVATKKYEIKDEFCKNDFHQTFQAQAAGLFSANSEIPATIQDAILLAIVANMGAIVDNEIWQGAGTTGHFSGLLAQFVADGDVIDVTGATVTATNVLDELGKVYAVIPEEIYNDTNLVMAVSPGVARAYKQKLASGNAYGNFNNDQSLDFLGVRMESIAGLPANTILAYRVTNVAFLTGLEADMNEVRVIDMDAYDGSDYLRTKVVFNAGVGYSFGSEIVYYRP
jgi:hypothetical protein